jgi:hypothetical protein
MIDSMPCALVNSVTLIKMWLTAVILSENFQNNHQQLLQDTNTYIKHFRIQILYTLKLLSLIDSRHYKLFWHFLTSLNELYHNVLIMYMLMDISQFNVNIDFRHNNYKI